MATQEEVFEQVKGILSQQLGVDEDEVTIDSSFQADLDADSLDLVETEKKGARKQWDS